MRNYIVLKEINFALSLSAETAHNDIGFYAVDERQDVKDQII